MLVGHPGLDATGTTASRDRQLVISTHLDTGCLGGGFLRGSAGGTSSGAGAVDVRIYLASAADQMAVAGAGGGAYESASMGVGSDRGETD